MLEESGSARVACEFKTDEHSLQKEVNVRWRERKGEFGSARVKDVPTVKPKKQTRGSKNDAGILVEGPLKEAELGWSELDPVGTHLGCRGRGGRHHSLSRSWEARVGFRV